MIKIQNNISLKQFNTFNIDVIAKRLISFNNVDDVYEISNCIKNENYIVLGSGSNILFTKDFDGIVIKPEINSIEILEENERYVLIKCGAGVIWDEFVQFCIKNDYGGIENLSLIPGTVGASPIQNIGAYGVEVKEVIDRVDFFEINKQKFFSFKTAECRFNYRDSIFKHSLKGKIIITSISFKLTRKNHAFRLDYGNLKNMMDRYKKINLKNIREAVVSIRKVKLPDPQQTGNAGSFFKNPVVEYETYNRLIKKCPGIPSFKTADKQIKIPAAWLIDKCGWKGKSIGNVAVHKNQPLVLINETGNANGKEILNFAQEIIKDVKVRFEIELKMEVNIL